MELFAAIAKRHSYRGDFKKKRPTRAHLRKIVQAGIHAPSGCNKQTASFVIVDDPKLLGRIAGLFDKKFLHTAPAMIVCVGDPTPAYGDQSFMFEDCAAAVENMLLAITALGYATVWLDGVLRGQRARGIAKILRVPASRRVMILLPVGVPVERRKQAKRKPFAQRAAFNKFPKQ